MKKKFLLLLLSCVFVFASCIFASCKKNNKDSGDTNVGEYNPESVSSEVVVSTRTDGVKYAEDALGGESFLYRLKGSEVGILPNTNENSTPKIQSALERLKSEFNGGLLYLEKGVYKLNGQINLPVNTGIVGDWIAPVGEGVSSMTAGTVFEINFGVGTDSEEGHNAAITTAGNNMLKGITFGYSNQNAANLRKYPYTIANMGNKGFFLENLTFVNSYRGILINNQNVYTLKNIYMTALRSGVKINYNYDIPELYNVNISYKYWAQSGDMFKAPSATQIRAKTRLATAFSFGRVDWLYLDTTFVEGYEKAYYYYRNTSLSDDIKEANGQHLYMNCVDCKYGVYVDTTSAIGNIFTRCDLSVTGEGSAAVCFSEKVQVDATGSADYNTGYQFNSCKFTSDEGYGIYSNGRVVVNTTYCDFTDWGTSAIYALHGSYVTDNCTFADKPLDIDIASTNVQTFKVVNCTFDGEKNINNSLIGVENESQRFMDVTKQYSASIAKYSNERYVPAEIKEPNSKNIYYASDYGVVADGTMAGGGTDNTEALQHALNAAGANGGGYVVLDGGFYFVKNRLVVPNGVHLIGNAVSNRHFTERKESTTLITAYGKNKEKTDNGFITLKDNSALRGLCVFYPDQDCVNVVKYSPTVSVVGNNAQINKTTFVGGYINFYVTGENALISYARGLGLNAGFIAEGINSGRFEYMFFSINDWMKTWDNEVPNAPPEGWHARYPNFENDTFVFENCKNVTLYHSFSYAQGTGLRLEGNIENFHGIGVGIDMGRNSLIMNNSGSNNVFVNTEFASLENNILTGNSYTAETTFYASANWFSGNGVTSTIGGNGIVNVQQFHMQKGSFTVNGGTVNLQGLIADGLSGYVVCIGNAKGGCINSVGSINGFLVDGSSDNFTIENCTKRLF